MAPPAGPPKGAAGGNLDLDGSSVVVVSMAVHVPGTVLTWHSTWKESPAAVAVLNSMVPVKPGLGAFDLDMQQQQQQRGRRGGGETLAAGAIAPVVVGEAGCDEAGTADASAAGATGGKGDEDGAGGGCAGGGMGLSPADVAAAVELERQTRRPWEDHKRHCRCALGRGAQPPGRMTLVLADALP